MRCFESDKLSFSLTFSTSHPPTLAHPTQLVTNGGSEGYALTLCNTLGTPLESKYIEFAPLYLDMTEAYIVAANKSIVYIWIYKNVTGDAKSKRDQRVCVWAACPLSV